MSDRCVTSQAPPRKEECVAQAEPALVTCQAPPPTDCDENKKTECGGMTKVDCGSGNKVEQQQQVTQASSSMSHGKYEHTEQAKFEQSQQSKYEHNASSASSNSMTNQQQQHHQLGQNVHQQGGSSLAVSTGSQQNSASSYNHSSASSTSHSANFNQSQSGSSSTSMVSGQYGQGQAQVSQQLNQGNFAGGNVNQTNQSSMALSHQQQQQQQQQQYQQQQQQQHQSSTSSSLSNSNTGFQHTATSGGYQGHQQVIVGAGQNSAGQVAQHQGSNQFQHQQQSSTSSAAHQSSQQQHHASSSTNSAASNSGVWVTSSTGAAQAQTGQFQNVNTGRVDNTESAKFSTQGTFQGGNQGNVQGQFASTGSYSSWTSSKPNTTASTTAGGMMATGSIGHQQQQQQQQQHQGQAAFANSQWTTSGSSATGGMVGQASTTYGGYNMTSDGRVTGQTQTVNTTTRPSYAQQTQVVTSGQFQGQASMTGRPQQTLTGQIPMTVHSSHVVGGTNYNHQQHQAASSSYSHQASSASSHQASSSSSFQQQLASQGQIGTAYHMTRELDFGGASESTDRASPAQDDMDVTLDDVDKVELQNRASTYRPQHVAGGPLFFGPFIKFGTTYTLQGETHYSVLVIAKPGVTVQPSLAVRFVNAGAGVVGMPRVSEPVLLDTYAEHRFWRFLLTVPMAAHQSLKVEYMVNGCGSAMFNVPSKNEQFKWAFMTCNGFSSDVKPRVQAQYSGIDPLWTDILREHAQKEFHGMVIGGDTVYMDDIWTVPAVKEWLDMRGDKATKVSAPWTAKMNSQAHKFYFDRYMAHFTLNGFAQGLASMPYLAVWDDHDIFDGFGSYPAYLQNSPVFRGIFVAAQRFYLLFQHHTNLHLAREKYSPIDNYIGAHDKLPIAGHTAVRSLGMRTAIVMLDTRTERSLTRIVSEQSWDKVRIAVENHLRLNPTIEHLVLCATVPMIYPRMHMEDFVEAAGKLTHGIMSVLGSLPFTGNWWKALTKTGVYGNIVDSLGEPQLLDDLNDHWTSDNHIVERDSVIMALQGLAQKYRVRVSLVSGDVHCGGAGEVGPQMGIAVTRDQVPAYMTQIISSAVGNVPPPWFVIKGLHYVSKQHPIGGSDSLVERMLHVFDKDVNGHHVDRDEQSLVGKRNWLSVCPEGPGTSDESKTLAFTLHVEKKTGDLKGETVDYTIRVPHVAGKMRPKMTEIQAPADEMHILSVQESLVTDMEAMKVGGPETATPLHLMHQQQGSMGLVGR